MSEISTDKVHLVLWDNTANMAKAMRKASLPSLGCFTQLLEDGVLSQHAVIDVLATCKTIVDHFSICQLLMIVFAPFKSVWEFLNTVFNKMYIPNGTLPLIWLNL